jgi:hypothetical protein
MATTGPPAPGAMSGTPLERAQAVWQAAAQPVAGDPDERADVVLGEAPDTDPSTPRAHPYGVADDLSRQRRKREERLLAQALPDEPNVTIGDLVADVLAAAAGDGDRGAEAGAGFDVRTYLADRGHDWPTIKTVMDYLERQDAARALPASGRRPLP